MKLNIGKPTTTEKPVATEVQAAEETVTARLPGGLVLGKPKVQEPAPTLGQTLAAAKPSPLSNLLANKGAVTEPKTPTEPVMPVKMAQIGEKYVLDAEATETLPQAVLEEFAAKMQSLLNTMGTLQLQTALPDLLNFTQAHPHLRDILRADDIRIVTKAAREAYGLTVVAKTSNSAKATKTNKLAADILADLADIKFTL